MIVLEPDLSSYDILLLNTSGGKDSQAMIHSVHSRAAELGLLDRLVAVHCDLGRVEWKGTKELAALQCSMYGIPFEVVRKPGGDLLDYIERRGKWPSNTTRYCTSDFKRGPVRTLMTKLVKARWEKGMRKIRILNCMGLRAEESPARAKRLPFRLDAGATNKTKRHVDEWLPIHSWTVDQVWDTIRKSGVPHHWAYDLGMPRLSCVFCLAGETEVVTRSGIRLIRDLAGATHSLLVPKVTPFGLSSHGTFVEVPVHLFGIQRLLKITLRRTRQTKVVFATQDHRWFVVEAKPRFKMRGMQRHKDGYEHVTVERTTEELQVGDRLRTIMASRSTGDHEAKVVPFAVAQGFVYGDGTKPFEDRPASLTVYDWEKDKAMLPFFARHEWHPQKDKSSVCYGLPRLWKQPPSFEESRSFLLSWLSGYFAADGCVSELGQARISSASLESVQLVRSVAAVCGIGYGPVGHVDRVGTGVEPTRLYNVNLNVSDLPDWFFWIESHKNRVLQRAESRTGAKFFWRVESVEETSRVEEVFCAAVPEAHAFALTDELLTGNCIFAPKPALMIGGMHNPELLADYVAAETRMGHTFRKDEPIRNIQIALAQGEKPSQVITWSRCA